LAARPGGRRRNAGARRGDRGVEGGGPDLRDSALSVLCLQPQACTNDRLVQALLQDFARRQLRQVFSDMDAPGLELKHFNGLAFLTRTEDEANGLLFTVLPFVAVEPAKIELHLSGIRWFEVADLQLDHDQPPQASVVEKEIDVVVITV